MIDSASFKELRLIVFDVDGVLTDGRIVLDDQGRESKFFNVKDGTGLKLMIRAGFQVALLTGRRSRVVDYRAAELGLKLVYQGVENKLEVYEDILKKLSLADNNAAYAGDDLVDLPVMRRVGLALAPADAVAEVKEAAHWISRKAGGRGAVREMAEFVLKGQGLWPTVKDWYC